MRKRVLSILLTLCLVLTLLPSTALADAVYMLYVGDTLVFDYTADSPESPWVAGTTYYWNEAESGDYVYAQTGNSNDYLFSVNFDEDSESFTLTLNGIDIISYLQEEVGEDETINYGILCTTALNIYLNDEAVNSIDVADTNIPYGIFTPGILTIRGDGNLTVTGSDVASQTGICGVNGVTIEAGEVTVSNVGFGITANSGPITVSGGTVIASALGDGLTANNSGIIISGGQLTALGNSQALYTTGSVSVTANPYSFKTNTDASTPVGDYTQSLDLEFTNNNTLKYVEIISCHEVYVGGKKVSGAPGAVTYWLNDNTGSITDSGADADHFNAKYERSTRTLTLRNANLTGVHSGYLTSDDESETAASVFALSSLNIVLEGENQIAPAISGVGIVTKDGLDFDGDGSIIINANRAGIFVIDGNIDIHSGSIDVEGNIGISASCGDINIYGGNISAEGAWYGINSYGGDININGGTVSAKSLDDRDAYGVGAREGEVAEEGGHVVIRGGTLIAEVVEGFPNCYGVYGNNSVVIVGGTVIASAVGGTDNCYGVYSDDYVEILGGAVYAQGGTTAFGVRGDPSDYINPSAANNKCAVIMTKVEAGAYTLTVLYNNAAAPVVYNPADPTEGNDLWVGGFPFCKYDATLWTGVDNSAVYGDFFHDNEGATADGGYAWRVGYDTSDAGYNLYMNGISIRESKGYPNPAGICANVGVDIDLFLEGTSINDIALKGNGSNPGGIIVEDGALRIYGTGTLNIRAILNAISVYVGNVTIEGGTINAVGGPFNAGLGVYGGNLTINDAIVNACGYCGVITINTGTITVTDGTLTAKGGGGPYGAINSTNSVNAPTLVGTAILGAETGGSVSGGVYTAGTRVNNLANVTWSEKTYREGNTMLTYIRIAPSNAVTCTTAPNGSLTAEVDDIIITHAAPGDTVTLTAAPSSGYTFSSWNVYKTGDTGTTVSLSGNSFTMPAYAVTVEAVFAELPAPPVPIVNTPTRTITVTETSSKLFDGAQGTITAEANMDNAFSNSVEVKVTDTAEDVASFRLSASDEVYPFDISLYIKGTNTKTEPADGYAVTISLPIPENLVNKRNSLLIAHKSSDGTVTTLNSRLIQKDSVWYLVFEATEFSPYALVVKNSRSNDESAGVLGEFTGAYDEFTGVPYYTDVKGIKIFIGFAANGKYIAPEGVTVLVMHNDKSFTDVAGHWALPYVGFTTERELFLGTGGNKFSPELGMTRAMFAAVIGRLYERSFGGIESSDTHAFIDCHYGSYYGKYVDWADENEIIMGIGSGKFAPDTLITREQMAAILYRFADFLSVLPDSMDTSLEYPDDASISSYAKDAALYCQTTGIIGGRTGGVFAPQETATRAEVATIIQRFIEAVMK